MLRFHKVKFTLEDREAAKDKRTVTNEREVNEYVKQAGGGGGTMEVEMLKTNQKSARTSLLMLTVDFRSNHPTLDIVQNFAEFAKLYLAGVSP